MLEDALKSGTICAIKVEPRLLIVLKQFACLKDFLCSLIGTKGEDYGKKC